MRVAVPVWHDKVSPVLDTASKLLVVEMGDQGEAGRFEIPLDERGLPQKCSRIRRSGVEVLICGAVSRPFSGMLSASGIQLIPDISGTTEDVLQAWRLGGLSHARFLMPGCKWRGSGRPASQGGQGKRKRRGCRARKGGRPILGKAGSEEVE
jgi:predicted Fe-Mo cluster-binding NifX family protein